MTKESERVNTYRKKHFDQVPLLIEKGGRALLRTMALREGLNTSAYLRRAALDRAGLSIIPYDMDSLEDIHTQEEAAAAVRRLQEEEKQNTGIRKMIEVAGPEANNRTFEAVIDQDTDTLLLITIQKFNYARNARIANGSQDTRLVLTGEEVRALRRALANMKEI
jgi:hypothetical protein